MSRIGNKNLCQLQKWGSSARQGRSSAIGQEKLENFMLNWRSLERQLRGLERHTQWKATVKVAPERQLRSAQAPIRLRNFIFFVFFSKKK